MSQITEVGANRRLRRILRLSQLLGGGILVIGAWWYYAHQREALESSLATELAAIADVKSKQIANWRAERIGDGEVLLSAAVAGRARHLLISLISETPPASEREELRDVLQRFISAFHYAAAAVVDRKGESRLDVNPSQGGHEHYLPFLTAASDSGGASLSDLYLADGGRLWMLLKVPIPGAGTLFLDIDPSTFLYPYVRSWPTASRTGETILARREGSGLVDLSGNGARGANFGMPPLSEGKPAGSLYRWNDNRGVPVMGVIQEVSGSNWYLIAKLDVAEAEAPLQPLAWGLAALIALFAITDAVGASLIWRNRQVQVHRERETWFRQITNDTPAYLWMTAPGSGKGFMNTRCARFFGVAVEEADVFWGNYVHPEDKERAMAEYSTSVASQSEYRDEFRIRRFDGAYRWMMVHGLPRYTPAGEFAGYAGALTDVTERREAQQHLLRANQELASELRERTRSEQEVHALTARLINAQEEERTRLARELHDDLSQQIAVVSIGMSNLKKRIPAEAAEAIEHCNRLRQKLVNLAGCIRRLSHELHPAVLQHSGLADALRNYCTEFSAFTSHRIAFREEGRFDSIAPAVALCVYRVAQEALQNSIKHARVDEAEVVLTCLDGVLTLVVSDHGIGMDPDAARGLGLVSIRERTRLVNGTVEIEGKPGEGVTLTLRVPLSSPGKADSMSA